MVALPGRNKHSEALANSALSVLRQHEGPRLDQRQFATDFAVAIQPALRKTFTAAAAQTNRHTGEHAGEEQLTSDAARWSEQFSQRLAEEIAAATQQRLDEATAKAGEDPDAAQAIQAAAFSPERALAIGVTETTRAAVAGRERIAALVLLLTGRRLEAYWSTSGNLNVCQECCAPLEGEPRAVWAEVAPGGPPYHPHCECDLEYR